MKFNPSAITVWAFTTGIGWLWTSTPRGAVIGLVIGLGLSLLAEWVFEPLERALKLRSAQKRIKW